MNMPQASGGSAQTSEDEGIVGGVDVDSGGVENHTTTGIAELTDGK